MPSMRTSQKLDLRPSHSLLAGGDLFRVLGVHDTLLWVPSSLDAGGSQVWEVRERGGARRRSHIEARNSLLVARSLLSSTLGIDDT